MWFGTWDGLNRYDGYTFKVFKNKPDDANSLSHNSVWAICEDKNGMLWIGTESGGLNRFDRAKLIFTTFRHIPDDPASISHNQIHAIFEGRDGFLWVGTHNGLNRFDTEKKQFTRYLHRPQDSQSLSHNTVQTVWEDRHGMLWVGTENGLNCLDRDTGSFRRYHHDADDSRSLSHDNVKAIVEDRTGTLWIGTENGLNRFDRKTASFVRYKNEPDNPFSLSHNEIFSIYEDHVGNLWLGTEGGGINIYVPEKQEFIRCRNDPDDRYSLSHDVVWSIFEDRFGSVWVGTYTGGLNKFCPEKEHFIHFKNNPSDINSLSHKNVWAIHEDDKEILWIGTDAGLNRFDRRQNLFEHFRHDPANPNSLSHDEVWCIYEDRTGLLWVGTYNGLNTFDRKLKIFTRYMIAGGKAANKVKSIHEDSSGALWIGTEDGLNRFDRDKRGFTTYRHDPGNPSSLSHNTIWTIYQGTGNRLWIGSEGGLNRFDPETEKFIVYQNAADDPTSLSNNWVLSIYEDQNGTLWVGTLGGLNRFNPDNKTFKRYGESDGLLNEVIYGILEDNRNNLWVSTNKGLSRFNPKAETFVNYTIQDGLQDNEFNVGAYHKTRNGELLFGGINGFNLFLPKTEKNRYPPEMVFTDFRIFYKPVQIGTNGYLTKSIAFTNEIGLSYKDRMISFEFAALHFASPEKNQYAYMMEGFDKNWIYSENRHFATYTNIPPGRYVFRVKGSNYDDLWNEQGVSLKIDIAPPLWKTWWAYLLYAITLLTIISRYVWSQKKKLERERIINEELRKADRLKDEFLANTSHELRTPLIGIIGLTESLIDGAAGTLGATVSSNLSMIVTSGKRLATLINDILDFSKLKNKELVIQCKSIDIRQIAEIVLTLSRPLIAGKPIDLKNRIPMECPPVNGDENRLQQILYNLVSNAIKFTESGSVEVSAQWTEHDGHPDHDIVFMVSDTGIGIPENKFDQIFESFEQVDATTSRTYGGTGLGLTITRQLIELHGGKIWVSSDVGKGTTFHFTLPVSDAAPEQVGTPAEIQSRLLEIREDKDPETMPARRTVSGEDEFQILAVDDEPVNLQVLYNQLTLQNYRVEQAKNGIEALQLLNMGRYDLVLLDVMMPRLSGYEVCQKIRETHSITTLPIIMLTAKNQVIDMVEGFESGANDYLTKPFSKTELNQRIKTHIELSKINMAYSRFVPAEFLRILDKQSIIEVKLGDQIEQEMSVMFSDIRSFTSLSEKMTPQENFNFINSYLSLMEPIIAEYSGFIDKYIGDAIMALFPTTPDNAISCSVAMLNALKDYNLDRQTKGSPPIRIGIGINTGMLMLGTVGGRARMDGTVISDAVNLASRIEGLTKQYGTPLLITEQTFLKLKDADEFFVRVIDRVQVKGKKEAVTVYEVFNADEPEIIDVKCAMKNDFDTAFSLFQNSEFEAAQQLFRRCLKENPDDRVASIYIERCEELKKAGSRWEGVMKMTSK